MSNLVNVKKLAAGSLATVAIFSASQSLFAHTRLQTPVILEGTRVYNSVVIGHGCHNPATHNNSTPVIGTSVVFPDATATVSGTGADGTSVTDWLEGAGEGYSKKVYDTSLFPAEGQKTNALGNVVGFWAGGGNGLPGVNYVGTVPFRTDAIRIKSSSCAKSVTFVIPIADVCQVTNTSGFSDETVNLWTPAVGSQYDGSGLHAYDSPATLKVVRNTAGLSATPISAAVEANPLPAECGTGIDVTITPTAEQINRDLPAIQQNGVQVWPQP